MITPPANVVREFFLPQLRRSPPPPTFAATLADSMPLISQCLLWTGCKSKGYGILNWRDVNKRKRSCRTHRLAWKLAGRSEVDCIRPICGRKLCCNAEHWAPIGRPEVREAP